jgi:hypothetical protein
VRLVLRNVRTGKVLDTVTVGALGAVVYETGEAKPIVEQVGRTTGVKGAMLGKALAGWSNGYLALA